MILAWLKKRKQRRTQSQFNNGFDYAVGALVRGDKTEEELEILADNPFDGTEYEDGMLAGLRSLRARYVKRDDQRDKFIQVFVDAIASQAADDELKKIGQRIDEAYLDSERFMNQRQQFREWLNTR